MVSIASDGICMSRGLRSSGSLVVPVAHDMVKVMSARCPMGAPGAVPRADKLRGVSSSALFNRFWWSRLGLRGSQNKSLFKLTCGLKP